LLQNTATRIIRPKLGRPRKYPDKAAKARAYRKQKKCEIEAIKARAETEPIKERAETPSFVTPRVRYEVVAEAVSLRVRLIDASHGNIDALADIAPIRALIEQGCDLEADILPVIEREVPELQQPLRNWGAQWLAQEILAQRNGRLARAGSLIQRVEAQPDYATADEIKPVEAPAPVRRVSAMDWDEFVSGHRAGLIEWNTARLGPKPGKPGCRAPAEVLREHGFRP
jgi:hypothetical protein